MRAVVRAAWVAVSLAVTGGCSERLTGGDAGTITPRTGRTSFVVTSTLIYPSDAGARSTPSTHRFTMVLDWDAGIAILGSAAILGTSGQGSVVPLEATRTGGRIGQPAFLSASREFHITYKTIDFAIGVGDVLMGTGDGQGVHAPYYTDVATVVGLTMSLIGVPDVEPPSIASVASGFQLSPFNTVLFLASEPLPPDTRLALVDLRGDSLVLPPPETQTTAAFSFAPPAIRMWRYDNQYTLRFEGIVDFAGNAAAPGSAITFTTSAPPPLVMEDGFESATGAMLAGAELLSGVEAPIISGARSGFIPPQELVQPGQGATTQLALRLALSPGDTVVRFSYRTVKPSGYPAGTNFGAPDFMMGSEGGQILSPPFAPTMEPTTFVMIPGYDTFEVGPIATADFALPPDAAGEITLTSSTPASGGGLPRPPTMGLIIDDLRAE